MTRRSPINDVTEAPSEAAVAVAEPALLIERGSHIPLTATVLRVSGPWVHLDVAGQVLAVLRSRLETLQEKDSHNGR